MIGEELLTAPSEADLLRQQLVRAQRLCSVGTLASSVAHEFNNILTTIINYAKLGLRPQCTEASRIEALEKILKGSQRAAAIVKATTFYDDPDVIAKVSRGLGEAMVGINVDDVPVPHRLAERGW